MVRLATIMLVVAAVGQTAFADLDQSYNATPDAAAQVGFTGGTIPVSWAQTFTVGITGQLTGVDILVQKSAPTMPLLFDLRTTIAGVPTLADAGGNILASISIPGASVPSPAAYLPLDVTGAGIFVSAGDVLAIVLRSNGAISEYGWLGTRADGYAGGQAWLRLTGGWGTNVTIHELDFNTYVTPAGTGDQTIPEPASLLLLAAGLGVVAWRRRR